MCEIRKNSNNLTIQQKVFIYKFHARVYYCIHVERKGALDVFFAFFCVYKQSYIVTIPKVRRKAYV